MFEAQEDGDDGKRHYGYCFTRNNYTECDENAVFALSLLGSVGACGKERGEQGTPHFQGFVMFETLKSWTQVTELLPQFRIAIKSKHSLFSDAWDYCLKGEQPKLEWTTMKKTGPTFGLNADAFTWGTCPMDAKTKGEQGEAYYKRNAALAFGNVDAMDPSARFRLKQFQESETLARRTMMVNSVKPLEGVACHHFQWHTGVTGSGKSHWAKKGQVTEPFTWTPDGGWNGYDFQDIVVFMDVDHKSCPTMHQMKTWFDLDPFPARVLYGNYNIRPKTMIVNTNEASFEEFFVGWKPAHVAAVKRRFKCYHWPEPYYLDEDLQILNPAWKVPDGL